MNYLASRFTAFKIATMALMFSLLAFAMPASATPGSVAADAIEAVGPQVTLVIGALVTVIMLIVAWKLIKKSFS